MRLSGTARVLSASLAVATVLAGCAKKDPVQALVDDLEEAAEDKDAGRFHDLLTDDFNGQGGIRRAEATAELRRYFAAYEKVAIEVYDLSVQRADGSADVSFRVEFSGQPLQIGGLGGLLPPGAAYRFDLHVLEQPGTWKVQRAAWESVAVPEPGR
jgi:Domain of unknown function (DUF4440)